MSALFATFRCYPVGESTLRRALGGVDTADLQRLTAAWAQAAGACNGDGGDRGRLPAVAIDPMHRFDHQSDQNGQKSNMTEPWVPDRATSDE